MKTLLPRIFQLQAQLTFSSHPTRSRPFHTSAIMSKFTINSKLRMLSGYEIPILGYGVYKTPADIASEVVQHAIKTGYRHVDSAVAYRNEAAAADGLKKSGVDRSELFFTTKVPPGENDYEKAKVHIDHTLKITGLEYVDLYLLHAPYGGKAGRIGAWKALVEGVEAGKIRSIGVSNYGVHHLDELWAYIQTTDAKEGQGKGGVLSINQVELHPWLSRKDIDEWCQMRGVLLQAYCPLVRATKIDDPLLVSLAQRHGKTTSQILLRWSLQKGFILLPKSVTESRIEENAQIYDFELTDRDMQQLDLNVYEPCAWDPTVSTD